MLTEQDISRVLEATCAISSTLNLSELLQTVMRLASEVARTEASSLLLLDAQTGELVFDVALGEKGSALQQVRLKKGEGIAGWVAAQKKPAVVNDVSKDSRWTLRADRRSQFQTRSILAVPLQIHDKLIGVVEVINRRDGAAFTDADAQMLEAFAAQAAVAIENARLFESVRQEKEKMSTILAEMSEGAVLLNPQGVIVLANAAAHRFLGRQKLAQTPWADMESSFEFVGPKIELRAIGERPAAIELKRQAAPALLLSGIISAGRTDRGAASGYLVVFRDVTEERREAQLKKNFLSLVSHKLRTPLVAIRGFAPLLLEKPEGMSSTVKMALETIDRNSRLLSGIVEKLTSFSALESDTLELQRKSLKASALIGETIGELDFFLKEQNAVAEVDASVLALSEISVDPHWMKEALRNLVENAVKFNPQVPRRVQILASASKAGWIEISIADNGPGIPSEEQVKIFQKFYQIEGNFTGQVAGMGLGLSLVKRVSEAHGGSVSVHSTLGKGSTFIVTLPVE